MTATSDRSLPEPAQSRDEDESFVPLLELVERIDDPVELFTVIEAAVAKAAATTGRMASSSVEEIDAIVETTERVRRRLDYISAVQFTEVNDRGVDRASGYLSARMYFALGQRLGPAEAKRREANAYQLSRLTSVLGESLDPKLPVVAAAVAEGVIGQGHVTVIYETMKKIPGHYDTGVRAAVERDLVDYAKELAPNKLAQAANRILAHLDPDGSLSEEKDRARRRGMSLGSQDRQLMSRILGDLTPEARSLLEVNLDTWAAPGMNNPDDPDSPVGASDQPGLDPEVLAAAAARDLRSFDQRFHDAFVAWMRFVRTHRNPGSTRLGGELVITISDAELAAHAGVALTGTGTLLPISELIKLAADATPHLEVFRRHTKEVLYLGRGKRSANKAQRLALFGRDKGCTHPACDRPFSQTEAHHNTDWAKGGRTDISNLGAACGRHNRVVGDNSDGKAHWETALLWKGRQAGRMAWRTRPDKPWRLNPTHHPELVLDEGAHAPPDDDPWARTRRNGLYQRERFDELTEQTGDPDTWSGVDKRLMAYFGLTA